MGPERPGKRFVTRIDVNLLQRHLLGLAHNLHVAVDVADAILVVPSSPVPSKLLPDIFEFAGRAVNYLSI